MSKHRPLGITEYAMIKSWNDHLIEGAEQAILNIRSIPARDRSYLSKNQLLYWLDVVKALKWSTAIAAQSARIADHAGSDLL